MLSFGNNSNVVDDVARIFLEHKDDTDVSILSKIKSNFPTLTHEQRVHIIRQVGQLLK